MLDENVDLAHPKSEGDLAPFICEERMRVRRGSQDPDMLATRQLSIFQTSGAEKGSILCTVVCDKTNAVATFISKKRGRHFSFELQRSHGFAAQQLVDVLSYVEKVTGRISLAEDCY